ncbi:DinB family protein [Mucilaginibacter lutimaris]|uniref:DinB family protein n=1 Tax=Mucilaginibacter lutimaris TaxID=931629 RepID=A0ABW2ZFG0_9SPHI
MIRETLKSLIIRDLGRLKDEILAYQNEEKIWYTEKGISNSAGNLCLHLVGNLNTYFGAAFGNTGYVRNRPDEFALKNIPRAELISQIENTIAIIDKTFDMITDAQLAEISTVEHTLKGITNEYFFMHLAMHLSYHLGQVNYHRRLLDN